MVYFKTYVTEILISSYPKKMIPVDKPKEMECFIYGGERGINPTWWGYVTHCKQNNLMNN